METMMTDRTNFGQSLMHKLKGNLGAGILAMPATFAHCGLINALIGLPILCCIAGYCVHLLIKSSRHLENKMNWNKMDYAALAKGAFNAGPKWMQPFSRTMSIATDAILIMCQMGICCVYLVFIADNLHHLFRTYSSSNVSKYYMFLAIFPIITWLSCIKTLNRLAIASTIANFLQVIGVLIVIEHLIREMPSELNLNESKSLSEIALGFGSAIFSFEGIAVALPVYIRMKQPDFMDSCCGVINASYTILLVLYFLVGSLGYLKYGKLAKGSITLNLPREPLYDCVRGIFSMSLALTYPLQLYVPAEIFWKKVRSRLSIDHKTSVLRENMYEYICRIMLVLITYTIAMSVPKLNLIMDLFGSISGTALSIILPAIIHLATFWDDTSGASKVYVIITDFLIVVVGIIASSIGTYFSGRAIWQTFGEPITDY